MSLAQIFCFIKENLIDFLSLIVAAASLFVAACALHTSKIQNISSTINYCSESYHNIVQAILEAQLKGDQTAFCVGVHRLIWLFSYQFMLWQEGQLPLRILYAWSKNNCRQIKTMRLPENGSAPPLSFEGIWKQEESLEAARLENFPDYMNQLLSGEVSAVRLTSLDPLKRPIWTRLSRGLESRKIDSMQRPSSPRS